MPVSGLSFDESEIFYNEIPLAQCSDGEKLMVSLGISMALNPDLRVLRIKDGSLLGPKNMEILKQTVQEKDYQLWIERVMDKEGYNNNGKVGIFIEEGEITEVEGEKPVKVSKTKTSPVPTAVTEVKDDDF